MCLIIFAYKCHPKYKLIVAANRDEFYQRPTAGAHFWEDIPGVLAGRDLEKMGTWMGVTKGGRFVALTNYRNPQEVTKGKLSRGELVTGALTFQGELVDYMESLKNKESLYPGYNLLAGDSDELFYFSNVGHKVIKLEPGIYGVSNELLDSYWPKVNIGKKGLENIVSSKEDISVEALFALLAISDPAPDDLLPQTGVPIEMERMLSPLFIKSEGYGTRSSTVLLMTDKDIQYEERVHTGDGNNSQYNFKIEQ